MAGYYHIISLPLDIFVDDLSLHVYSAFVFIWVSVALAVLKLFDCGLKAQSVMQKDSCCNVSPPTDQPTGRCYHVEL